MIIFRDKPEQINTELYLMFRHRGINLSPLGMLICFAFLMFLLLIEEVKKRHKEIQKEKKARKDQEWGY